MAQCDYSLVTGLLSQRGEEVPSRKTARKKTGGGVRVGGENMYNILVQAEALGGEGTPGFLKSGSTRTSIQQCCSPSIQPGN